MLHGQYSKQDTPSCCSLNPIPQTCCLLFMQVMTLLYAMPFKMVLQCKSLPLALPSHAVGLCRCGIGSTKSPQGSARESPTFCFPLCFNNPGVGWIVHSRLHSLTQSLCPWHSHQSRKATLVWRSTGLDDVMFT